MNAHNEWLRFADSNFEIAKNVVKSSEIRYEDLCNQLQQAVEKALKALLVFYGEDPPKTHNLYLLLHEVEKYENIPDSMIDVIFLNDHAVLTRYPGNYTELKQEDFENSLTIAEMCLSWVRGIIKTNNQNKPHNEKPPPFFLCFLMRRNPHSPRSKRKSGKRACLGN